jgi:XTP/dITP diphosphohydrolase
VKEIVIATRNKDKIKEIKKILKGLGIKILSLDNFKDIPKVIEDGKTFEENASKKARIISKYTHHLTIADDSGLEVDVLNGRPGVKSARFAGRKQNYSRNNKKLLKLMKGIPTARRKAKFVCVISIAKDGKVLDVVRGVCRGRIGFKSRGRAGFGYDPVFISPKYDRTFAELGTEIKNKISHRYQALKKAKKVIKRLLDF